VPWCNYATAQSLLNIVAFNHLACGQVSRRNSGVCQRNVRCYKKNFHRVFTYPQTVA